MNGAIYAAFCGHDAPGQIMWNLDIRAVFGADDIKGVSSSEERSREKLS